MIEKRRIAPETKPDQFKIIFNLVKAFGRRKNLGIDVMVRRMVMGGVNDQKRNW